MTTKVTKATASATTIMPGSRTRTKSVSARSARAKMLGLKICFSAKHVTCCVFGSSKPGEPSQRVPSGTTAVLAGGVDRTPIRTSSPTVRPPETRALLPMKVFDPMRTAPTLDPAVVDTMATNRAGVGEEASIADFEQVGRDVRETGRDLGATADLGTESAHEAGGSTRWRTPVPGSSWYSRAGRRRTSAAGI